MQGRVTTDQETKGKEFLCVATYLPVRRWRHLLPFLRMTSKVMNQLKKSEGAIRYTVKADFPKKRFWTLSIWSSKDALRRFVMSEPHATAVRKFSEWAGEGAAFVEWSSATDLIGWNEALQRLQNPTFYYRKEK